LTNNRPELREALIRKLNPARFPGMSGKMAAIVGYVLNEEFADPVIVKLQISDKLVLVQHRGDIGFNDIIGATDDLHDNWRQLLEVTSDLTDDERAEAHRLFVARIR